MPCASWLLDRCVHVPEVNSQPRPSVRQRQADDSLSNTVSAAEPCIPTTKYGWIYIKQTHYCTFAKYRLVNFETCAVRDKIRTTHSACHEEIVTRDRRPRAPVLGAARDAP